MLPATAPVIAMQIWPTQNAARTFRSLLSCIFILSSIASRDKVIPEEIWPFQTSFKSNAEDSFVTTRPSVKAANQNRLDTMDLNPRISFRDAGNFRNRCHVHVFEVQKH